MNNNKLKVFLIVCVVVFLTGLAATLTGLALHGWKDLDKLPGDWHINEGTGFTDTYTLSGNDAKFEAMDLNLAFCEVEYMVGDEYRVELTYDTASDRPDISIKDGTLTVTTNDEHFISGDDEGFTMTLEITVPEGTKLNEADLTLDACQADFSGLDAKNLDVSFDIGEFTATMLNFENASFNLGACDATIQLAGEADDYDYDISSGIGSISLDGTDVQNASSDGNAPKYYDLEADISDVEITYQGPAGDSL